MSDTEQQAGAPAAAEEEEDLDALWNGKKWRSRGLGHRCNCPVTRTPMPHSQTRGRRGWCSHGRRPARTKTAMWIRSLRGANRPAVQACHRLACAAGRPAGPPRTAPTPASWGPPPHARCGRQLWSPHSLPALPGCSEDSATKRRKAAEAKLKDFGEGADGGASAPAAPGLLPSAAAAFTDVDGPPAFLDPEVRLVAFSRRMC